MDAVEEPPPCHAINNDLSPVGKGKRTKRPRPQSPTNYPFTQEEEDTATCLVLLAQGYFNPDPKNKGAVYACKTCDRVFSSFQALGGHRTGHKKPKTDKRAASFYYDDFSSSKKRIPPPHSSLSRVHECSYCGAEFTSGQALGGHMRRHRVVPAPDPEPNSLSLDLNFPAPDDEYGSGPPEKLVVPTLVDCHF